MRGLSFSVIADDLTGASEIAAIGLRSGLKATVFAGKAEGPLDPTSLSVFDTDSRLLSGGDAARVVSAVGRSLKGHSDQFVFKKIDSVLRGNVVEETVACARALGLRRALLLPANPSFGRVIRRGTYFIQGIPLAETSFALDPHHPAPSSQIVDLLTAVPDWPVSVITLADPLPASGLIVGEASSITEINAWVKRLDPATLAVGGAESFSALIHSLGAPAEPVRLPPVIDGPTLIVSGSTAVGRAALLAEARIAGWPLAPMPAFTPRDSAPNSDVFRNWIITLAQALSERGLAVANAPDTLGDHSAADMIRRSFGEAVAMLHARQAFRHLVVEGGATAAAVTQALQWTQLDALAEWSPGVVILQPRQATEIRMTMKPGSYPWPDLLRSRLHAHAHSPATK